VFRVGGILHLRNMVSQKGLRTNQTQQGVEHTIESRVVGMMKIVPKFPNTRMSFVDRQMLGESTARFVDFSTLRTDP